ncbi:ribose-phosphate pyrophosphokinase [Pyrodictium occultum]|uniref:ribose-phosphate diphosphokinase n=1 Tax=Pyrodictium occultum TaxID=2309 RepID=A0A0V8RU11_PYROC|nr:ribose-phosphate pyrophosphokinase [Pyrodictium occultum]KSW11547.1 ribose-phosphate pyrophosphokinase [Pyrodictium occultum]
MAARYVVVAAPGVPESFAEGLARSLGAELARAEHKLFPDGESYVRIPAGLDGAVAVVASTGYPEPTRRLWEAALLAEASRGLGASHVVAVMGYTPYSRQDRRFIRGEPVSIRVTLGLLASSGAEAFAAVDLHKPESLHWFPGPAASVDPSPAFAERLRGAAEAAEKIYVIAPDRGAFHRARRLAERLGAAFDYLEKSRDRVTGEITMRPKTLDVRGATVVIVDDIVSTGGTMARAAEILLQQGAREVIAACTHGLFAGDALQKLRKAGVSRILAGNTVKPPEGVEEVDVSRQVAAAIDRLVEAVAGYEQEKPQKRG